MKHIRKFENFNPYDDEPLTRSEQLFGKQTRLEKQFSNIMVDNLINDETATLWSTLNALKIEIVEAIGEGDVLIKELQHRIVEGEDAVKVFNSICDRIEDKSVLMRRLIDKINKL